MARASQSRAPARAEDVNGRRQTQCEGLYPLVAPIAFLATILLVGGLCFLPAPALGPIAEALHP
jgi:hypothetical protein